MLVESLRCSHCFDDEATLHLLLPSFFLDPFEVELEVRRKESKLHARVGLISEHKLGLDL